MSKSPVIVVFTGNSNSGNAVITALASGAYGACQVRAVVRKESKIRHAWKSMGVETIVADITRKPQLEAVFQGPEGPVIATLS